MAKIRRTQNPNRDTFTWCVGCSHIGFSFLSWKQPITTLFNLCSVHRGCSVYRGVFSTSGEYHEYIRGILWVHRRDIMSTSRFSIQIERFYHLAPPHVWWYPQMYSWYPPDVLMVFPQCTEHPPMYWTPSDVLMVSPDVLDTIIQGDYTCIVWSNEKKDSRVELFCYYFTLSKDSFICYWNNPISICMLLLLLNLCNFEIIRFVTTR